MRSPIERFLSKVDRPEDADACWIWQATVLAGGYGQFWFEGRMHNAHRVAYILLVGPIPEGDVDIDHKCHGRDGTCPGGTSCPHRRCVNPAHLEAVTPQVNTLRGRGPAAAHASKTHCKNGHPFDEANTYNHPTRNRRVCIACDREASRRYQAKRRAA